MGYNNQSTVYGNQGVGTAFVRIDGKGCTMEDITVTGYGEDGYGDGEIYCCKLNIDGSSKDFMYWIDAKDGSDVWYGWYAEIEGENYVGDKVELAAGESIWLNSPEAGWTLNWPSAFNPDSNAEERATK